MWRQLRSWLLQMQLLPGTSHLLEFDLKQQPGAHLTSVKSLLMSDRAEG